MRIVADTNVIISGLFWHGNPRHVLNAARDGIIDLYTSPVLLEELENVLSRTKFLDRLKKTNITAIQLVRDYADLATLVEPKAFKSAVSRDIDDDHVISCAVEGECEVIVSGDDDLLELKEYSDIKIMNVTDFLIKLRI